MKIQLFICTADKERVDKTSYLEAIGEYDGSLRAPSSVEHPSILLDMGQAIASTLEDEDDELVVDADDLEVIGEDARITHANYMYIQEFGRYYFIDDIMVAITGLYQISASVDPLMSFRLQISGLTCYIARNEFDYLLSEQDDAMPLSFVKEIEEYAVDEGALVNRHFIASLDDYIDQNNIVMTISTTAPFGYVPIDPPLDSDLPQIMPNEHASNGASAMYIMTTEGFREIATALFTDSAKASFVKSAVAFPFIVESRSITPTTIYFGEQKGANRLDLGGGNYATARQANYFSEYLVFADFRLPSGSSFLDYAPYTRVEVYIPFLGYVEVNRQLIRNDRLILYYAVNYEDGSATAYLYDYTKKRLIYSSPCQLGVKLAVDTTNAREIETQKSALNTNLALGSISSVMSLGVGLATANPIAIGGAVLAGAKTIANYNNSNAMLYERAQTSFSGSSASLFAPLSVSVRITRTKTILSDDEMDAYAHAVGRPLRQVRRLSTLRGFTIAQSVHLDDVPCLSGEAEQIKTLLSQGVIL